MTLSYRLDDRTIADLKAVDLKAARTADLLISLDGETLEAIHRQARVSTIGATTRIENAMLTDAQIDWMDTVLATDDRPTAFAVMRSRIEAKLSADRERSLEEVAGCREMMAIVYSQGADLFPLTQTTLRGMHQVLLGHHPADAHHRGRYKVVPNSVVEREMSTGRERTVLRTSDPGPITEAAMERMLESYNVTVREHPWPIAVGCEMVFRFLACHPFQDGNGRMGRALFLLALLQSADPALPRVAPYLAVDRFIERNRAEYYAILARVSGGRFHPDPRRYRIVPFLRFMLRAMDDALDSIVFYRRRVDTIRSLPDSARSVLQCFKDQPEQRLTPSQLRQSTRLPERTVSRVLASLAASGLLQRYGRGPATRYQLVF